MKLQKITVGMRRRQVDHFFRYKRAVPGAARTTCYYEPPDTAIEIAYDLTGGVESSENRVIQNPVAAIGHCGDRKD
jgi:hypothetical protein